MYPIDLSDKVGIVFGVANHRSIAWAIAEDLACRVKARTLFATHSEHNHWVLPRQHSVGL